MGADHLQTFLVHVFRHHHSFSLVSKLEEDAFLRRVLVLHKGSFHITHAFSALVSFGSDDFHEKQIHSLEAVCMDGGHEWSLLTSCCRLLVAGVLIECWKYRVLCAIKRNSAVARSSHGRQTWVEIVSRPLFVAAVLIACWESRVPYEIILLALIGYEQKPTIYWFLLTYLLTYLLT